ASFTHSLETLLDELRANRLQVTQATSDLLLKSVDAMRDMLRAVQAKQPIDAQRVADLQFDAELILAQRGAAPGGAAGTSTAAQSGATAHSASHRAAGAPLKTASTAAAASAT